MMDTEKLLPRSETPEEKEIEFEDVLETVGSYGRFQRRLLWGFLIPMSLVSPFLCSNQVYLLSVPKHWCHEPAVSPLTNLSSQDKMLLTIPVIKAGQKAGSFEKCTMYNLSYGDVLQELHGYGMNVSDYVKTFSQNWSTVSCQHGWEYDKSHYTRTASTYWNLVCDEDFLPTLTFTAITVGSAVGTPIFGTISDRIGRKACFLICSVLGVISSVLTVLLPTFSGFLAAKILGGALHPSVYQLPYLIVVEMVSPDMRTWTNGAASIGWSAGFCFMALVAWLMADWVYLAIFSAVVSIPYVVYYWMLPESPRWLISQGRFEEASKIFQKAAEINGRDISGLDIMALLKQSCHQDKEEDERKRSPYLEFFRKPTLMKRFFFITINWTADAMTYYGFHINVSALYGNEFLNFFLLALVEIPGYFLIWYVMDTRLGRRWSLVIFRFMTAFVCFLPIIESEQSTILTTVASLIGKFGVAASFMTMYQQTVEVFPTTLRASGLAMTGTIAQLLSIATPSIVYLKTYGHHIPYTILGVIGFVAGCCAFFVPETLNENLPQTVEDGENFGKDKPFFHFANTKKPPPKIDVRKCSHGRSTEMFQYPTNEEASDSV